MTTKVDEIIDEIRRRREAHAASLDYDLKRITHGNRVSRLIQLDLTEAEWMF